MNLSISFFSINYSQRLHTVADFLAESTLSFTLIPVYLEIQYRTIFYPACIAISPNAGCHLFKYFIEFITDRELENAPYCRILGQLHKPLH